MSTTRQNVLASLSTIIDPILLDKLLDEYQNIKEQYALGKFGPAELNGGRFSECVFRVLQHLIGDTPTPLGTTLPDTNALVRKVENQTHLPEGVRLFVPKMARVLLDVRNRRDVAHIGGDVSPNVSDSLLVVHTTDWIMTELVRSYYGCSISEAKSIVLNLNELKLPVVVEIDGFVRIQNSSLKTKDQILVILYHKYPSKVKDVDLQKWTKYGNVSRFKKEILKDLDDEVLVHYQDGQCTLLPKGIKYVDKNIPLDFIS